MKTLIASTLIALSSTTFALHVDCINAADKTQSMTIVAVNNKATATWSKTDAKSIVFANLILTNVTTFAETYSDGKNTLLLDYDAAKAFFNNSEYNCQNLGGM
jgi:hypothetical protein